MSKQLCKTKVREGNVILMGNTERESFSNESRMYYFIWVEFDNTEFPIALTPREYNKCVERGSNIVGLDSIPLGHVCDVMRYCIVRVNHDGKELCLSITPREYERFVARAVTNIEDIPRKSFLTDMLD